PPPGAAQLTGGGRSGAPGSSAFSTSLVGRSRRSLRRRARRRLVETEGAVRREADAEADGVWITGVVGQGHDRGEGRAGAAQLGEQPADVLGFDGAARFEGSLDVRRAPLDPVVVSGQGPRA